MTGWAHTGNSSDDKAACAARSPASQDLLDQLRALYQRAGSPAVPAMKRHADRAGLRVGRNTFYDLIGLLFRNKPGWPTNETVAAFVQVCTSVISAENGTMVPEWRDPAWWEKLRESDASRQPAAARVMLVGRIPPLAAAFQHRDLQGAVGAAVGVGKTVVLSQVLSGLGGVGKTQLAARHAEEVYRAGKVALLVWIGATSRQSILDQYRLAARMVGLTTEDVTADQIAEQFLNWLRGTRDRWLVVLDDLINPNDMSGLWPPGVPTGATLVTTRRADAALAAQGRTVMPIGVYRDEEAHRYLRDGLTPSSELADDVTGVADDLGYLPLALSHAVAYMKDNQIPCGQYRDLFTRRKRLADVFPCAEDALPDEYRRTVTATLALAVKSANNLQPRGLAEPLLELAAVLDGAGGIPRQIMDTDAVRNWVIHHSDMTATPWNSDDEAVSTAVNAGLHCLRRLNLVTIDDHTIRVHNLVQAITRDRHPGRAAAAAWATADAVEAVWPDIDTTTGPTLRSNTAALTPHLHPDDPPHPVRVRAARSLAASGDPAGAVAAVTQVLADSVRTVGADHPDTLTIRAHLSQWRDESGDVGGAIADATQLLDDRTRVLGPDHPETLKTRASLASWRGESGDVARAVADFEQLLVDETRVMGPDHPDILITRGNLAHCRGRAGDVAGAAVATEELLADYLRVWGPEDPRTLTIRSTLAFYRGQAGDPTGAADELEELLADRVRILGSDHPTTLNNRADVARWRGEAGNPAAAGAAFERLLADQQRIMGADHPKTMNTRSNLAHCRGQAGDPMGAAAAFAQLLADQMRVLGPDHPDTLTTRNNLAHWQGDAGDLTGAIAATKELLADQLRVMGPDHPDCLITRLNLASWRGEAGDPIGAAADFQHLLADVIRVLGPDHPNTLATRNNLAHWRGEAGDPTGAAADLKQLHTDQTRLLGPDHPQTLLTRHNLEHWRSVPG